MPGLSSSSRMLIQAQSSFFPQDRSRKQIVNAMEKLNRFINTSIMDQEFGLCRVVCHNLHCDTEQ
jgi:hypothetical protein